MISFFNKIFGVYSREEKAREAELVRRADLVAREIMATRSTGSLFHPLYTFKADVCEAKRLTANAIFVAVGDRWWTDLTVKQRAARVKNALGFALPEWDQSVSFPFSKWREFGKNIIEHNEEYFNELEAEKAKKAEEKEVYVWR